ncbi:MAG: hypothetical protein JWP38_3417 [Herbaspirillum sp.]|nr:hypothetical protein [Herbaspirillum sp.]
MNADKLEINNQRLDASQADATLGEDIDKDIDKAARNRYASELAIRFRAYMDWAMLNWPARDRALDPGCFRQSREELDAICRQIGAEPSNTNADPDAPDAAQFVPVTPMPWP